jgi:putative phosphoribosyl transferase
MIEPPFRDRADAGRLLAAELASRKFPEGTVVLALPRSGVPVAVKIAESLRASLDVVPVRKLGVPWQPELAMGALAGQTRVLDDQLIRDLRVSDAEVEAIVARETAELGRQELLYRKGRPPLNLKGRTVLLVDDGIATGSTMLAAARHVKSFQPEKLIIAVPVCSAHALTTLKKEVHEVVYLAVPEPFFAVGEWYTEFQQIRDAEVQRMLAHSQAPTA